MKLSDRDLAMLAGELGPAAQLAMRIVVRMAEIVGAAELRDVSQVHVDGCLYEGQAGIDFAERLVALGARVAVPTTLNVGSLDLHGWHRFDVPEDFAAKAERVMRAYLAMGCEPTWTCAPYQTARIPRFGEHIAWAESNAVVFANSVIGARTNRYPDYLDICAAITGRVPNSGLHLTENRRGQLLIRLVGVPDALFADDTFYPVLGYLVGTIAADRVPVVDGITVRPTEDQLKALGAAAASSGAVALFHLVGITPEAPTLTDAFQGGAPTAVVEIGPTELRRARAELSTTSGERLDFVVLGSPHFSLPEFRQLAALVAGRRCHPNVRFIVTSSRAVRSLLVTTGLIEPLVAFGVQIVVDTCILTSPILHAAGAVLMTNSAKYAYYVPGKLGARVVFGSLADCVESAVVGRIVRDESAWQLG